ncbi:MAG: DUF6036 family nucleotidyltransferase [Thermoflexales bacterium]
MKLFSAKNVRYLVVGGYAVTQYAEPRYTRNLDVWIATDAQNAAAVYAALKEYGAPLSQLSSKDFSQEGYFYQMGSPPVRVDVLMGIPGVAFEDAWARRVEVAFGDVNVSFISKDDLITAKIASGRPQDLIDVANLGGEANAIKGRGRSRRR